MIICSYCGRDIDVIGSDNVSETPGQPLCEDCARSADYEAYVAEHHCLNDEQ